MTDREASIRSVCEQPEDDTVRLVFADWLDGQEAARGRCRRCNGTRYRGMHSKNTFTQVRCECRDGTGLDTTDRDRAEFIRVQVELASFDTAYHLSYHNRAMCENSAVPLVKRSAELLHPAWSRELAATGFTDPTAVNQWEFRRGFVSAIELPAADFLAHAAAIFAAHPVTAVALTGKVPSPRHIGAPPANEEWGWCMVETESAPEPWPVPYFVPAVLRGHWPAGRLWAKYWVVFDSETEAVVALSAACVNYARSLVGLPPLNNLSIASLTEGPAVAWQ